VAAYRPAIIVHLAAFGQKAYESHMKTTLAFIGFVAILVSLPLSWWLIERARRDPQARLGEDNRARVDRLSAGTNFGGGGYSA
jgi:hypothetical protein